MIVEVAIILPLLILMIFAGTDMIRYVQTLHQVDLVSASLAARLSRQSVLQEADFEGALGQAQSLLEAIDASDLELTSRVIRLLPSGEEQLVWMHRVGGEQAGCSEGGALPHYLISDVNPAAPRQQFFQIRLCLTLKSAFYLTSILPKERFVISSFAAQLAYPHFAAEADGE
ncbi:MAG: TadE/TadG family type IV pilus assembly protein [Sneathiella sp.]